MKIKNFRILLISCLLILAEYFPAQNVNLENRFRLAESYNNAGLYDRAEPIYRELLEVQPWNSIYLRALNKLFIQTKNYNASIKLLEDRISSDPSDLNAYGLLGSTYYVFGDSVSAFKAWDGALDIQPGNITNYRTIANYAIENRAFDKAVNILREGKNLADDPVRFAFDLGNILEMTMNFPEAAKEYCFILENTPDQLPMVQSRLSKFSNNPAALEQTLEVVEEYSDSENKKVFLQLLSHLYIQQKNFTKAFEKLLELNNKYPDGGNEIFSFAQNCFTEGEFETASKAYSFVIENNQNSQLTSTARIGYARTLEASLDSKTISEDSKWKPVYITDTTGSFRYYPIIKAYEELSRIYPDNEIKNESLFRIARIKLEKFDDPEESGRIFLSITEESPLSKFVSRSYEKLGEIEISRGDLNKADFYFQKILKFQRATPEEKSNASLMRAKIGFWSGDFEKASQLLSGIIDKLDDTKTNDALELLVLINTFKNDSLNLRKYANADYLLTRKLYEPAENEFESLSKAQNIFILNSISEYKLAIIKIALNQYSEAILYLEELADSKENNLYSDKSLFLLANLYNYGLKDLPKAKECHEKLLETFPNSLYLEVSREFLNAVTQK